MIAQERNLPLFWRLPIRRFSWNTRSIQDFLHLCLASENTIFGGRRRKPRRKKKSVSPKGIPLQDGMPQLNQEVFAWTHQIKTREKNSRPHACEWCGDWRTCWLITQCSSGLNTSPKSPQSAFHLLLFHRFSNVALKLIDLDLLYLTVNCNWIHLWRIVCRSMSLELYVKSSLIIEKLSFYWISSLKTGFQSPNFQWASCWHIQGKLWRWHWNACQKLRNPVFEWFIV